MLSLPLTLDQAGLRDTHFDDGAFERRDDICASTVSRTSIAGDSRVKVSMIVSTQC